jgi:hypothetical protein
MPNILDSMVMAEYALVSPPVLNPNDQQSIKDFRTQVVLQTQGDPAIFQTETPVLPLALAFATSYDVATQALLRLDEGRLVLLFDHETRDLMSPEEIDKTVWEELEKLKNKIVSVQDVAAPMSQQTIDLKSVWSRTKEHDDLIVRTKLFLKTLVSDLTPAITLRVTGEIPALPFLMALYLLRPTAYTVEYADLSGNVIVLFFV